MGSPTTVNIRGGSPALLRMQSNGLTQQFLGTIPGTTEQPTNNNLTTRSHNRYVEIGEKKFVLSNGIIYDWDGAIGGVFTSVVTGLSLNTGFVTGFHTYLDPVDGACLAVIDNGGGGGAFRRIKYVHATNTWSTVAIGGSSLTQCWGSIIYDNVIYAWAGSGTAASDNVMHIFDPRGAGSVLSVNGPGHLTGNPIGCTFVGYEGIVYAVTWRGGVDADLFAILGGAFIILTPLPTTALIDAGAAGRTYEGQVGLYEQDGKIYIAIHDSTGSLATNGSRLYEYEPVGSTLTDVTTPKLHPILRTGGGLSTVGVRWRYYVRANNESGFGTKRIFIQVFTDATTGGSLVFEHVAGGNWVLIGGSQWTGGQAGIYAQNGGSDFFGAIDELSVVQDPLSPISEGSGVVFEVRCYGDPGSADKYLRLWHSTARGVPLTRSTMIAPTAGGTGGASVIASNQLEQVDADNGVTVFRFKHDAPTDGISPGDILHWEIEISPNPAP